MTKTPQCILSQYLITSTHTVCNPARFNIKTPNSVCPLQREKAPLSANENTEKILVWGVQLCIYQSYRTGLRKRAAGSEHFLKIKIFLGMNEAWIRIRVTRTSAANTQCSGPGIRLHKWIIHVGTDHKTVSKCS